jgi:hypothetical protein
MTKECIMDARGHGDRSQTTSIKPTEIEISRESRSFVKLTRFGNYEVKETVIIRKQTWENDAGIYAGKSYECGRVYHNGVIVRDWSTPWKS